jgi:multiple sugar transport system permease protein
MSVGTTLGGEKTGAERRAPRSGNRDDAPRKGEGRTKGQTLWILGTVVIVAYALFPVLWIASLSFKPAAEVGDGRLIPATFSLDNYRDIFTSGEFVRPLINSIGISLITTALAVVIAAFAAYAIARLQFPGKTVLLSGALAIAMFPPVSIIGPLFNIWRSTGLYDTWPGLILPYMTFALPLAIWTLAAFFREIPFDLEEAAQVDGATPFQAFRQVIVPLALPGIFTSAIIVFIFCWNDFLFAISLTSTDAARTVPAATAFFTASSNFINPTGQIAAAAIVVTVPIIVMVLVFQRRIVAGLTAGAVKG